MNSRPDRSTPSIVTGDAVPAWGHCAERWDTCAGFTLIEVVVALAIVAISLTAIGAVVTTSSRGTRSIEQHLALVETARVVATTLPTIEQIGLGSQPAPNANNPDTPTSTGLAARDNASRDR